MVLKSALCGTGKGSEPPAARPHERTTASGQQMEEKNERLWKSMSRVWVKKTASPWGAGPTRNCKATWTAWEHCLLTARGLERPSNSVKLCRDRRRQSLQSLLWTRFTRGLSEWEIGAKTESKGVFHFSASEARNG